MARTRVQQNCPSVVANAINFLKDIVLNWSPSESWIWSFLPPLHHPILYFIVASPPVTPSVSMAVVIIYKLSLHYISLLVCFFQWQLLWSLSFTLDLPLVYCHQCILNFWKPENKSVLIAIFFSFFILHSINHNASWNKNILRKKKVIQKSHVYD